MKNVQAHLEHHLHGMAAPFLFVGSGLTRRYLGTEGWEDLLRYFAEKTTLPYEYYRSTAEGNLPRVATAIADQFHEIWWRSDEFEASRALWSHLTRDRESALKVEVAKHLGSSSTPASTDGPLSAELDLLREVVVDGIITTNYDQLLESLFPSFRTFIGQDEMLFSNPQGVGEIYKIHGSCSSPDSLVLTAADYDRFEARNPYLAAKLLTMFVEHPVIFIGYSLSDRNVVSILRSVASCLTQENLDKLTDRLIFVQWQTDAKPSVATHTMLVDNFIIPVQRIVVPDYSEVFTALGGLRRSFPADLLRRLKEQVYDLVLDDDRHQQLYVADIDQATPDIDIDVVFGVGVKAQLARRGYVGLDRWNLIDDVMSDGSDLDASTVVEKALPSILRDPGNVPVFKYLRRAGLLKSDGSITEPTKVSAAIARLAEKNRGGIPTGAWHTKKAIEKLDGIASIQDLELKYGVDGVRDYAVYLPAACIDLEELKSFILNHESLRTGSSWDITGYVKLVCLFDWLSYGPLANSSESERIEPSSEA